MQLTFYEVASVLKAKMMFIYFQIVHLERQNLTAD